MYPANSVFLSTMSYKAWSDLHLLEFYRGLRYCGVLLVYLCISSFFFHPHKAIAGESQSLGEIVDRLGAIWDQQRSTLCSGSFSCRSIRRKVPADHHVTRDEVRELLKSFSQNSTKENLQKLAGSLDPRLESEPTLWSVAEYTLENDSFKVKEVLPGALRITQIRAKHNDKDVVKRQVSKNRDQINVLSRGRLLYDTPELADFVFIPTNSFLSQTDLEVSMLDDNPASIQLSRGFVTILADTHSGFVFEFRRGVYGQRNYKEILQYQPTTFSSDILLPGIRFLANYENNRLSTFDLRVLDEAFPNKQISDTDYMVGVEEGDLVVDQTTPKRVFIKADSQSDDVTEFVSDKRSINKIQTLTPNNNSWRVWFIAVNTALVVLILVGIVLKSRY